MAVEDILGVGKLGDKILEEVSKGLGTLYRPRAIRNEADAEAYRVRQLAKAESDARSMAAIKEFESKAQIALREADLAQDLRERIGNRLLRQEAQRQLNLDSIVEMAINADIENDQVSDQPIGADWRTRFFISAQDVSESDMQRLWATLLAGEVASPGKFSFRTLDILRNLTAPEAHLFSHAARLADKSGHIIKLTPVAGSNNHGLAAHGLTFDAIQTLQECGLLNASNSLAFHFGVVGGSGEIQYGIFSPNAPYKWRIGGHRLEGRQLPCYLFTSTGRELMSLLSEHAPDDFLKESYGTLTAAGFEVLEITGPDWIRKDVKPLEWQ